MNVKCNACEELTYVHFVEQELPDGLIETYFRCNECNEHYTCFVTDVEVRNLQTELHKKRGRGNNVTSDQTEIDKKMIKLKENLISSRK